jgi:hypothetical protein
MKIRTAFGFVGLVALLGLTGCDWIGGTSKVSADATPDVATKAYVDAKLDPITTDINAMKGSMGDVSRTLAKVSDNMGKVSENLGKMSDKMDAHAAATTPATMPTTVPTSVRAEGPATATPATTPAVAAVVTAPPALPVPAAVQIVPVVTPAAAPAAAVKTDDMLVNLLFIEANGDVSDFVEGVSTASIHVEAGVTHFMRQGDSGESLTSGIYLKSQEYRQSDSAKRVNVLVKNEHVEGSLCNIPVQDLYAVRIGTVGTGTPFYYYRTEDGKIMGGPGCFTVDTRKTNAYFRKLDDAGDTWMPTVRYQGTKTK